MDPFLCTRSFARLPSTTCSSTCEQHIYGIRSDTRQWNDALKSSISERVAQRKLLIVGSMSTGDAGLPLQYCGSHHRSHAYPSHLGLT